MLDHLTSHIPPPALVYTHTHTHTQGKVLPSHNRSFPGVPRVDGHPDHHREFAKRMGLAVCPHVACALHNSNACPGQGESEVSPSPLERQIVSIMHSAHLTRPPTDLKAAYMTAVQNDEVKQYLIFTNPRYYRTSPSSPPPPTIHPLIHPRSPHSRTHGQPWFGKSTSDKDSKLVAKSKPSHAMFERWYTTAASIMIAGESDALLYSPVLVFF